MDIMPEIMDGKNIADFIDPDIAEKLEALEREEEKLQAEGFYASDSDIMDSDDEREAQEAQVALSHKIKSQSIKKSKKNQSRLPRTAGLRTLTELTEEMTKAGLDPSRIQERAEMLAKVQGVKRKRTRDEDGDVEMDDGAADEGEDGWMDVDDDDAERSPPKRKKGNSGGVVALHPRTPKTNRQFAGLRDESVSQWVLIILPFSYLPL
jgi:nucleolar GTP-binding protein